jgi:hypothetical protein
MVERHLHATVLQSLPEAQRTLTDTTAFMPPMSESTALFQRCRSDSDSGQSASLTRCARSLRMREKRARPCACPSKPIFLMSSVARTDCMHYSGTTLEMRRGEIHLTPYAVVEQLLLRDEVELV